MYINCVAFSSSQTLEQPECNTSSHRYHKLVPSCPFGSQEWIFIFGLHHERHAPRASNQIRGVRVPAQLQVDPQKTTFGRAKSVGYCRSLKNLSVGFFASWCSVELLISGPRFVKILRSTTDMIVKELCLGCSRHRCQPYRWQSEGVDPSGGSFPSFTCDDLRIKTS